MDEPNYTEPSSVSPDRPEFSQFALRPMDSPPNSFNSIVPEPYHRRANRYVQMARIVKSSLSRAGESPYMEQIVIQKIKRPF